MNMKKKLKAFFTLNRRANDGFTLVELIVVIAILAILAGVAVPAYSGYIEKANLAADETVLSAVNTAFAAACIIEGVDNYNASGSTATVDANGKVTNVTAPGADAAAFYSTFASFFDSESAFTREGVKLFYKQSIGGFAFNETATFKFGNTTITLSSEDIEILSGDNAFSNRGSAALLEDVGALETYLAASGIGADILDEIQASEEFYFAVGGYLGLKRDDYADDDAYMAAVGEKAESLQATNPNASKNALIMYAASHAANASQEQIDKLFTGSVTGNIAVSNPDGTRNNEATMANAALAYGMYTAYMQRYPNGDAQGNKDFVNVITSDEFESYYATDDAKADLKAYMAAMNMVSDNTSNSEVTGSILANGIVGNTELEQLMKDVMGK